jgi:hypothetical protein
MAFVKFVKNPDEIEAYCWDGKFPLPAGLDTSPYIQKGINPSGNSLTVTSESCQRAAYPGDYLVASNVGFVVHPASDFESKHVKKK